MSAKLRVAAIISFLLVLGGMILLVAQPGLDPARLQPLAPVGGAWIAFGCAAWLLRKVTLKLAVGLILVGGIALQVVAMTGPPRNSTDSYRYIWDGRVQAAGIDPYLYAPADEGVARLRNDFLWSGTGPGHYRDCVTSTQVSAAGPADRRVAGCTKMNRPKVPTVYPPVAEAYFLAVQLAAPADDSAIPIQAAAARIRGSPRSGPGVPLSSSSAGRTRTSTSSRSRLRWSRCCCWRGPKPRAEPCSAGSCLGWRSPPR
jgi:hypothetical protein